MTTNNPLSSGSYRFSTDTALKVLIVLALGYTFYFSRSLILPIMLAALIALFANPAVRSLTRLKVPKPLAALLVLIFLTTFIGYSVSLLYNPAAEWLERLPLSGDQLALQVDDMTKSLDTLKTAVLPGDEDKQNPIKSVMGSSFLPLLSVLAQATAVVLFQLVTVIILTYFFLVFGGTLLRNMLRVRTSLNEKKNLVRMYQTIENDISRYVLVITIINIMLGVATFTVMSVIGVSDPLLWGVLATILNFAPYLGPFVLTLLLCAVGFIEYDTLGQMLLVPSAFLVLNVIESQLVTPTVLGKRFNMNPLLVVIWMFIWGWMWGVVGVLIAIPLLVCLKIIAFHLGVMPNGLLLLNADSQPDKPN